MKINCSGGLGVMEHEDCLAHALKQGGAQACGFDYVLLKAMFGSSQRDKRASEIHVTDLTGCIRKAWYDKLNPTPEYPHEALTRWLGTATHGAAEVNDEHVQSEVPISHMGIHGTADIVYEDGRLVDTKCQPVGELVTMADGTEKPIEAIRIFDMVLSWNGNKMVPAKVICIMDGGVQDVYEIRIASGKIIRVSGNHPVLTDRGFVRADELLEKQDRIINLKNWIGTNSIPIEDARLLGYLIGDGGTSRKYGIGWTNKDDELIEDFRNIVEGKGWDFHPASRKNLHNLDWRITNRGLKQSTTGPMAFIQSYCIHGKKSWEKTIPDEIMAGDFATVTNYLAAHFDTDGCVTSSEGELPARLSITTTSEKMSKQISELLWRLGISNRVYRQRAGYGGRTTRDAFTICVWQADMILRFWECIPFRSKKKQKRIAEWEQVLRAKQRKGGKNLCRIETITNIGPMATIGIEVEGTHTYVTNGVITHNTTRWLYPDKIPYSSHALQVNIYAYLLRKQGKKVKSLQIQYIDMSGPTKCRKCRMTVRYDPAAQEFACPQCGNVPKGSHLGAVLCEVPLLSDREVEEQFMRRLEDLKAAIESSMAPERESGYLCGYCASLEVCRPDYYE